MDMDAVGSDRGRVSYTEAFSVLHGVSAGSSRKRPLLTLKIVVQPFVVQPFVVQPFAVQLSSCPKSRCSTGKVPSTSGGEVKPSKLSTSVSRTIWSKGGIRVWIDRQMYLSIAYSALILSMLKCSAIAGPEVTERGRGRSICSVVL